MKPQPTITVVSTEVTTKQSKAGKAYYQQAAMFNRGDGASFPIDLFCDGPDKAHKPGTYEVALRSYKPSRYGVDFDPTLGAPVVASVAAKVA